MKLTKQDNVLQQEQQMQLNKQYAFFTLNDDKYVQIICEISTKFTVDDTIEYTLSQFDKELGTNFNQNKGLDYVLKIAKKSGEPKSDLPSLNSDQKLYETGCNSFTLVCKNPPPSKKPSQITVTTTMISQDQSIKARGSYINTLNQGKKPIKENQKEQSGGFCFFNKCI